VIRVTPPSREAHFARANLKPARGETEAAHPFYAAPLGLRAFSREEIAHDLEREARDARASPIIGAWRQTSIYNRKWRCRQATGL